MSFSSDNLSGLRQGRRRALSRDALKSSLSIPLSRGSSTPSPISSQQPTPDIDLMLEPAMDGPPSPERLRQLSKQMKRASYLNRPTGHRTMSSTSSPRSAMDGRPQWELALENMSLSRQPSNRSAESSNASRDLQERDGPQIIGRSFFQRSAKAKRASSAHSSSNSSMHSGEVQVEEPMKESLIPGLFARRKPSRDDTTQKKLQISGPFNFHHVTHHQRDNLQTTQQGSRTELASEFPGIPTPGPATAPGILKGIAAQDIYLMNNSVDSLDMETPASAPPTRPQLVPRHTAPAGPRRLLRSAKSSDQLRTSPPRPSRPQSPIFSDSSEPTMSGPVPPPRISSRQSLVPDGFAAYASTSPLDRPRTSGGFRQPQPFSPDESFAEQSPPPPATAHGYAPSTDFEAVSAHGGQDSHAVTTPDDAGWPLASPLASYEKVLPDVPEEDEHHGVPRRSRLSLASNNSLRASQSVPILRAFSQPQRRPSGASDTLGRFDMMAAQRAMRDGIEEGDGGLVVEAATTQDNWEDCIDYCYEHEADANFDYQWERPSLDVARDPVTPQPSLIDMLDEELAEAIDMEDIESQPGLATTTPDEVSLSPISNNYDSVIREAPAPGTHLAVTNNFSLPRGDKGGRLSQLKGIRPISYASSFKESQGFNLSPSLLIPGDYHQHMLMTEAEKYDYHGDDEVFRQAYQGPYHEEFDHNDADRSPLSCEQRSSTSTAETSFSSRSDTTGERHISANSTFTTLTRLTVSSSSTSLNKAAGTITESHEPMPVTQFIDTLDDECDDQEPTPPATKDTVPELTPFPMAKFATKPYHKSHASESVARAELASLRSQDPKFRRPRARTSSLSTQVAPPVGQYALFPRTYKGVGDRI